MGYFCSVFVEVIDFLDNFMSDLIRTVLANNVANHVSC